MMERLPQLILILGVFLTALASVDANVKSVFVFGDDQFDPGNNRFIKNCTFQANFRPYGSSFFYYPTGRFTNGRTIADFIAQFLGIKFQRPYQDVHRQLPKDSRKGFPQNGLNFASGGSGLLQGTNKDKAVTSIQAQLQQFHSLMSHKRLQKNQIEKSLFLLGSGGNDIFSYFLLHGTSKITIPCTYVHAMLKEVARFTSQIYKYGGRRFVFFSIGPIGCIPGRVLIRGASTNHCNDQMNSMAEYYNAGLKNLVYKIPVMYPGAMGVFGSMHDTTMKYHNNPESYGNFFFLLSLPHLIIFICVFVPASTSVHANLKSVFVFGDSQFDPGNNQFVNNCTLQANFTPYGSTYFHHPTGRFTNGRTVVDFLGIKLKTINSHVCIICTLIFLFDGNLWPFVLCKAAQFLGIKFQKPYQEVYRLLAKGHRKGIPPNGLNFASAGSGLLPYTNRNAAVTPIQVQLQQFQALITQKHVHKKQIKKSLFFIVSGANDVFSYFLLPNVSNMTQKTYVRAMLKEVKHFTSKIYKYGGRRIVLFSIGVIGCVPGRVLMQGAPSNRCIDKMDSMARYYNAGLKRFVKNIHKMFPGAIGVYAAVYDASKKYLDNPKLYGFANVTHACCGGGPLNGMLQCGLNGYTMCLDPSEYFFWDYFHPS
ncbi:hypothetical protein R6Q57_022021 [Mikania cordata]